MKHVLLLITTVIAMAISAVAPAHAQQSRTLKSEMEVIHESLGVNFVYDSAIEINVPYSGKPMKDIIKGNKKEQSALLEECLQTLFAGTGIEYEVMKKYIVLTQADKRKKPKDYTIFIEEQHDTINEASITAYINRLRNTTQTGLTEIDGSIFGKGFATFSSPDLIKELQNLPGVSSGTEMLTGMYVHGGDGNDNLFLLDGVPMYQISHFGGLLSSFNTDVIESLDFYKSGFPSRFGGKLSSVVDVSTRPGDMNAYHGSFNIGLLNGGLQFEGPIVPGRTSFNIALRRSWFDALSIPFLAVYNSTLPYPEEYDFRYAMTDLNASVTHMVKPDSKLSLNFYAGSDYIGFENSVKEVAWWDGVRYTGNNGYKINARWGNILGNLAWMKKFSDDLHLNTSLYYTRTNTDVSLYQNEWSVGEYEFWIQEEGIRESTYSILHDAGLKADLDWIPSEYHHLRTGVSLVEHFFRPSSSSSVLRAHTDEQKNIEDTDSYSVAYNSFDASLYAEDELMLTSWMKANLGLRYVLNAHDGKAYHSLEPRAALRFQLAPDISAKMSYSEMSQFIHLLSAHYLDIPMATWLPSTESVAPMRSRQVAGGVYFNLPHNFYLNVEGWWKTMDNLYEYCGIDSIYPDLSDWENELMQGKGRSYGAEVEFAWRTKSTDISAYYTLSWTERYFEGFWHSWYPARNDNRHKFTLNASHRFSKRFDMFLAWNYHTGNRMTVPTQEIGFTEYYASPYNYNLPDYHRLDLGFNFRKTTKRGNESIWNLSIYNVYCRMNPMFAQYDHYKNVIDWKTGEYEEKVTFKTMAAIPIIPTFGYTLRF